MPTDMPDLGRFTDVSLLILLSLASGPKHGYAMIEDIKQFSGSLFEPGTLYGALMRLEKKGWIVSKWETAKDRNREFKYYRLTPSGRKQLAHEESKWKQLTAAIARVMWPASEDES